ncbi:MAG: S1 RNA-binding domain-containing protein [Clostridiales bacterium]|jgi:S1 RNA binding domain protein|nr:S1 RNA-binding domain-containing protein [Clostridiales bacterium]
MAEASNEIKVGNIMKGKIYKVVPFGAFVSLDGGKTGMVHISEVSESYVDDIVKYFEVGQEVTVKVISIADNGKIALSIKKATQDRQGENQGERNRRAPQPPLDPFEEMMRKFKQNSEEKMHALKRKDKRN